MPINLLSLQEYIHTSRLLSTPFKILNEEHFTRGFFWI